MSRNQFSTFVIFLLLATPLIMGGSISSFNFGKAIFFKLGVEILFITYLILIIKRPIYLPKFNILTLSLALFLVSFLVSSIFGINFQKSFWGDSLRGGGFIILLHFFIFFLISSTIIPKSYFFNFFKASIFIASTVSLYALSQKIGLPFLFVKSGVSPTSTIGNTALLSGYLLFNIFFALYFFISTNKNQKWLKTFYLSFVLISVAVIYLANVRGAILGLIVGLYYFFSKLLFNGKYSKSAKPIFYIVSGATILVVLIFSLGYFEFLPLSKLINRFTDLTTVNSRFNGWHIAFKGWTDRPLFGWGPENFLAIDLAYFNPSYFIDSFSENVWDKSHSIFLEVLSTQGVFGLVVLIGLAIAIFTTIRRNLQEFKEKLLVTSAFIAYVIHAFFIFDSVSSFLMIFIVLAFLNSHNNFAAKNKNKLITSMAQKYTAISLIIIVSLSIHFFNIRYVIADNHFNKGRSMYLKDAELSIAEFRKAIDLNTPDKFRIRRELAALVLNDADLSEKSGVKPPETVFQLVIQEIESNLREEKGNLFDYLYLGSSYINYGRLYNKPLFFDNAEELLLKAQKQFSTRQQVYYLLAEAQLEKDENKEALSNLNKAVDLNPSSPESYWRLALAFKKMNRPTDAFDMAQRADSMKYGGTRGYLPDILRLIDIHAEANQYGQLISLYHRVMKIRPNYAQSYASVAVSYKEMGDKYSAIKYTEKAQEFDPASTDQVRGFIESMNFIKHYYGNSSESFLNNPLIISNKLSDSDLADWVNYYNEYYKLSISLPSDWKVYGTGGSGFRLKNDLFFNNLVYAKGGGFNSEGDMFANTIITTNVQDDLKDWFMENAAYPRNIRNETFYYRDVVVNGLPGIVQYMRYKIPMYNGIPPKTIKEYYFKKGDKIFQLKAYTVTGKSSNELVSTFDKIISTLEISD